MSARVGMVVARRLPDEADTVLRAVVEIANGEWLTCRWTERTQFFERWWKSHRWGWQNKNKAGQKSIAGGGGSKTKSGVTPSTKVPASLPIRDKLLADATAAKKVHEDALAIADKAATALKDEQSKLETLEAEVQNDTRRPVS